MNTKLNSHGVDVSKISKGDYVVMRVGGIDPKDDGLPVEIEYDNGQCIWVRSDAILRHIPADESIPAPAKSIADKPASEMTVKEKFFCDFMIRSVGVPSDGFDWDAKDASASWDAMLSALEGSAGK